MSLKWRLIPNGASLRLDIGSIYAGMVERPSIKRTVTSGGARIDLMPQEFKMLEFLVRHAGQVVTRTMLLENRWSFHFEPRTNIVESHISRIRSKLDRGGHRDLIRTVGGSGDQIDADL